METSDPDCTDKSTVTPEDIACIDLLMTAVRMQAERTSDLEEYVPYASLITDTIKKNYTKRKFDV